MVRRHPGEPPSPLPTDIDLTITEQFARSMSLEEALSGDNLLCYEMNGVPLPRDHGFPLRLIAPGWYGVANVKWLTRIEITDQRFAGRFMARDYVSIREQVRDGQTVWTFNTVKHDRLKSAPAKVTRRRGRYSIMGAAWGAPIAEVEVQIDDGPWRTATLDHRRSWKGSRERSGFAWRFWTLRVGQARRRRAHDPVAGVRRRRQRAAGAGRSRPRQQGHVLGEQWADRTSGGDPVAPHAELRRARGLAGCRDVADTACAPRGWS